MAICEDICQVRPVISDGSEIKWGLNLGPFWDKLNVPFSDVAINICLFRSSLTKTPNQIKAAEQQRKKGAHDLQKCTEKTKPSTQQRRYCYGFGVVPTVFWDSKLLIFSDHRVAVGLDQGPE